MKELILDEDLMQRDVAEGSIFAEGQPTTLDSGVYMEKLGTL